MPRLILLIAVVAVIYILYRRAQGMPPHKRRGEYIKLGLGVVVVITVIAAATGRMHWVGAAITGLLVALRQFAPVAIRFFPVLAGMLGNKSAAASAQHSTVETRILRMQLDHESGKLDGEVLEGQYLGWRLADMDRDALLQLREFCQREDTDSLQLLESYLEQRFPGEGTFEQQQTAPGGEGTINREQALAILGLNADASEEDIVAAHRKLMQKMHPDRGGSDYLAAKINQAKDFLLDN